MDHQQIITALWHRRLDLGLSQREVGRRVNKLAITIAGWESGATVPNAIYLTEWADALGCEVAVRPKGGA